MAGKIKPRITYQRHSYFFGVDFGPVYACESKEVCGIGATPRKAYDDWTRLLAKTSAGRFFQRIAGKVVDWFL